MSLKRLDNFDCHGCKNISELLNMDCTPLVDVLFKLSSIASNFASAANNTKNISVADKHEIEELLQLVFDIRKLAEKVEKLIEERTEKNIIIIQSGIFEKLLCESEKQHILSEAIEVSEEINSLVNKKDKGKK